MLALSALRGLLATARFRTDRMQARADSPVASATDLAEYLVGTGMPFREAHAIVGGLVRDSLERHVLLVDLVRAHPDLGEEAAELLAPGVAVARRTTAGGAGPGPVARQLARYSEQLEADRRRI